MNKKIKELVERVRLTPAERLQAEDDALAYLHLQGKVVGVDGFERRDIAYTVNEFVAEAQLNKVLKEDLALIDREKEEKEWANTQLIIQHLSDILTTAEEHHDARGNSNQTLFKMDLDRITQAIDVLKSDFTHSIIPLAEAIGEMEIKDDKG